MQTQTLTGGFADAPVEAARAFRGAMTAMSRPGTLVTLSGASAPDPVSPAAAALILTLCDPETGLHLAGAHDTEAMRHWVAFHTGAPIVAAGAADFALGPWEALVPLDRYRPGTPEYPDRSATLIVECATLEASGTRLAGPGIREAAALSLPDPAALADNARRFPLGLDVFFTCGDRAAGLPRSTRIG